MIITDGYRQTYIASIHRWSVYGYGEGGVWLRLGVVGYGLEWVVGGSGYFESGLQHFRARQSPATQPRRTVSDVCSYPHPGVCGLSFATISYASLSVITRLTRWRRKQPVNHPKNLSTKTRIFGCIYSGKFGTEVTASVMGSCHHPNMVTPQRVKPEMTVSKS